MTPATMAVAKEHGGEERARYSRAPVRKSMNEAGARSLAGIDLILAGIGTL